MTAPNPEEEAALDALDLSDIPEPRGKKCSPTFAFRVWQKAGRPSFRKLAQILTDRGYTVAFKTLHRWKDDDPVWFRDFAEHQVADIDAALDAMSLAVKDAQRWDDDALIGIKVVLYERLWVSVRTMQFNNVDEVQKGLDAADRIDELHHKLRGRAIKGNADVVPEESGAGGSVIAAFRPSVPIPKFGAKGA